jgi:hypothetical protein
MRITRLNPDSGSPSDTLPRERERNLTPHVASATAAPLIADRAAHRLKGALLPVRTVPLRNTQAVRSNPVLNTLHAHVS